MCELYITKQCSKCKGKGRVLADIPYSMAGDFFGCIPTDKCEYCNGTGYIKEIKYYNRGR